LLGVNAEQTPYFALRGSPYFDFGGAVFFTASAICLRMATHRELSSIGTKLSGLDWTVFFLVIAFCFSQVFANVKP
jgi:hypothetical protein